MQIISNEEAIRRLTSEDNILNRIDQGSILPAPVVTIVEPESELVPDQPIGEVETVFPEAEASSLGPDPASQLLQTVIGMVDENGHLPKKYRGQRGKEVPSVLRAMAAVEGHLVGTGSTAKEFGMSPSQISEYKRGRVGGKDDEDLRAEIEQELSEVRVKARRKLLSALALINKESLGTLDALQLSNVAKNMSAVVEKATPVRFRQPENEDKESEQRAQFVVVVPPVNTENKYKQLQVG